jgi:hypothetical protein
MSLILTKYPGPDDAGPADEILHAGGAARNYSLMYYGNHSIFCLKLQEARVKNS